MHTPTPRGGSVCLWRCQEEMFPSFIIIAGPLGPRVPGTVKNNANNHINLHMNYLIVLLLKFKVTSKSESKLYNYNKIFKGTNIKL